MSAAGLFPSAGCIRSNEIAAVKARIDRVEQQVGAVNLRLERRISTGGGDVNEPVTGWILAAGYSLVPASFLVYLLAHRWRAFRALKQRLRGTPPGNGDKNVEMLPLETPRVAAMVDSIRA